MIMNNLKTFEKLKYENLIHKYEKYLNKFFLSKYRSGADGLFMCKMIKIQREFITFEYYEFDENVKEYEGSDNTLNIRDFNKYYKILNSFDTFEEMKKEYKLINYTKKYNL